jgi:hypothetical protein
VNDLASSGRLAPTDSQPSIRVPSGRPSAGFSGACQCPRPFGVRCTTDFFLGQMYESKLYRHQILDSMIFAHVRKRAR